MADIRDVADDLLSRHKSEIECQYDLDPDRWACVYGWSPYDGNGMVGRANFESMREILEGEDEWNDQWHIVHGAYGSEMLLVELLDENGKITDPGTEILECLCAIEDYPVLDDSRLSDMELEEAINTLESGCYDLYGLPIDQVISECAWIVESAEGAYFGQEEIDQLARDKGYLLQCIVCEEDTERTDWNEEHEHDGRVWIGLCCEDCAKEPAGVALLERTREAYIHATMNPLF